MRLIDADAIIYERHEKIGLGIDYNVNEDSYYDVAYKIQIDKIPTAEKTQLSEEDATFDCISRQAAIAEFNCCEYTPDGGIDANYVIGFLEQMPSAEKTGRWSVEDCHAATYKYCCSNCKAHHRARYDFCPSCGARMKGETND